MVAVNAAPGDKSKRIRADGTIASTIEKQRHERYQMRLLRG